MRVISLTMLLVVSVLFAQSALIDNLEITTSVSINNIANTRISLRADHRSRLVSCRIAQDQLRQGESSDISLQDNSSMCYGFEGVISTAAKTPDYYTIIAYEYGTSNVLDSFTADFTFPTPCSYVSPVFCEPHVDALALAYDANGQCVGRDFVPDLWVNGGTGSIEVDFYCD